MMEVLSDTVGSVALMYAALASWSLTQTRHQKAVLGSTLSRGGIWVMRLSGCLFLLLVLKALSLEYTGLQLPVMFCGVFTVSAMLLVLMLAYRPRNTAAAGMIGILAALLLAAVTYS